MVSNEMAVGNCGSLLLVTEDADLQQLEAAAASAGLTVRRLPIPRSLRGKAVEYKPS